MKTSQGSFQSLKKTNRKLQQLGVRTNKLLVSTWLHLLSRETAKRAPNQTISKTSKLFSAGTSFNTENSLSETVQTELNAERFSMERAHLDFWCSCGVAYQRRLTLWASADQSVCPLPRYPPDERVEHKSCDPVYTSQMLEPATASSGFLSRNSPNILNRVCCFFLKRDHYKRSAYYLHLQRKIMTGFCVNTRSESKATVVLWFTW